MYLCLAKKTLIWQKIILQKNLKIRWLVNQSQNMEFLPKQLIG